MSLLQYCLRMSDDTKSAGVQVPTETQRQFPDLIAFILKSESMNDEERQYWIDILPIMTPDQLEQLKGILQNERAQLAAIDAKYAAEIDKSGDRVHLQAIEQERRTKQHVRTAEEQSVREKEEKNAEDILSTIE